jgi:valyl-tRNA synthetase
VIVPPRTGSARRILEEEAALIGRLVRRCTVTIDDSVPAGAAAHAVLANGAEIAVPLAGIIDLTRECTRLQGELAQLETQLGSLSERLRNERFLTRAPADLIDAERRKESEWTARRDQLREKVRTLCG